MRQKNRKRRYLQEIVGHTAQHPFESTRMRIGARDEHVRMHTVRFVYQRHPCAFAAHARRRGETRANALTIQISGNLDTCGRLYVSMALDGHDLDESGTTQDGQRIGDCARGLRGCRPTQ